MSDVYMVGWLAACIACVLNRLMPWYAGLAYSVGLYFLGRYVAGL